MPEEQKFKLMTKKLSILYVGSLAKGSTSLHRYQSLKKLAVVNAIDTYMGYGGDSKYGILAYKVCRKIKIDLDILGIKKKIKKELTKELYDILWLDKATFVDGFSLKSAKLRNRSLFIVGYSPDYMFNLPNLSFKFLHSLKHHDLYINTKSYALRYFYRFGCRTVKFVNNAYQHGFHRRMNLSEEEKKQYGGPVGFIGIYEKQRSRSIFALAKAGIKIVVWGDGWEKSRYSHHNIDYRGRALFGDEYVKAINAMDINLTFLRKINRDLQTTRSIEIPACGAFMLAERTNEHQKLFREGVEAEFFSSDQELIEKLKYYLKNDKERKMIAREGMNRCYKGGYSNENILSSVLYSVMEQISNSDFQSTHFRKSKT